MSVKELIQRTTTLAMRPLEDIQKEKWTCTVQVLVNVPVRGPQDTIRKTAVKIATKELSRLSLYYEANATRLSYHSNRDDFRAYFKGHLAECLMKAREIENLGGTIIAIVVSRPSYLPKDNKDFISVVSDNTEFIVFIPEKAWDRLEDRITKSRKRTNIAKWRECLDWVKEQMKDLHSHKNSS